jgi:hypothetical protein
VTLQIRDLHRGQAKARQQKRRYNREDEEMKRSATAIAAGAAAAFALLGLLFVWAAPSAAELAPGDKLDVDQSVLDDLVTANRILATRACSTPSAMSACAIPKTPAII